MIYHLREFRHSDAASLAENADNPLIAKRLRNTFPHPYKEEDAMFFINLCLNVQSEKEWNFVVDVYGSAVGCIGLIFGRDVYCKSAELGFWLGEDYWGNGIMTSAVEEIVEKAFRERDIVRIYAEVFEDNYASEKVLLKAGFSKEAVHRKSVYKDGTLKDSMIFVLLKQEMGEDK